MKKKYEKPMILFEDFTVSTNVAAGCERIVTSSVQDECVDNTIIMPGATPKVVFITSVEGCKFKADDGDPYFNGLCYHNPTDDKNLFNS